MIDRTGAAVVGGWGSRAIWGLEISMRPMDGQGESARRASSRCARRLWRWRTVLVMLGVWQLAMVLLAAAACVIGVGKQRPAVSNADLDLANSMVSPSAPALEASLTRVAELQELHAAAKQEWRAAMGRVLAGESPKKIAKELNTSAKQATPLYRPFLGHLDGEQPMPRLALRAVAYGHYDEAAVPHLRALPALPGHGADTWPRAARFAELLVRIEQGRFQEASQLLKAPHAGYEEAVQRARGCLERLQVDALDFEARMDLAGALCRLSYGQWFRSAHMDMYWRLYQTAGDRGRRGRVLLDLASLCCDIPALGDLAFRSDLYVAAGRLLARQEGCADQQAAAIAGLADLEERTKNRERAMALYGAVSRDLTMTPAWGRSTFNYGLLLREAGYPTLAAEVMRGILSSGVNDAEPAPCIMAAYRNYRHNAAVEISRSYGDRCDFPREYYWRWLASRRHPYLTWCGTCRRSEEKTARRELAVSSLRAGPLFFVFNAAASPRENWAIWCIAGAMGLIWWYFRRRRGGLGQPAGQPVDGATSQPGGSSRGD